MPTVTEDQQQDQQQDQAGTTAERRSFPPCECGSSRCGGRPEAGLKLTSPYPPVSTAGARSTPPAVPYVPRQVGEVVLDTLSGRLGRYMDRIGRSVFLRPESGGPEWETDPGWIDRPPGSLGAKLSERNRDSRLNSGTTGPA